MDDVGTMKMEHNTLKVCVFVLGLFWCTDRMEVVNSPVIQGF